MTNPTPTPVAPEHELSAERIEELIAEIPPVPYYYNGYSWIGRNIDNGDDVDILIGLERNVHEPRCRISSGDIPTRAGGHLMALIELLLNSAPAIASALRDRDRLAEIVARNTCECGHEAADHDCEGRCFHRANVEAVVWDCHDCDAFRPLAAREPSK